MPIYGFSVEPDTITARREAMAYRAQQDAAERAIRQAQLEEDRRRFDLGRTDQNAATAWQQNWATSRAGAEDAFRNRQTALQEEMSRRGMSLQEQNQVLQGERDKFDRDMETKKYGLTEQQYKDKRADLENDPERFFNQYMTSQMRKDLQGNGAPQTPGADAAGPDLIHAPYVTVADNSKGPIFPAGQGNLTETPGPGRSQGRGNWMDETPASVKAFMTFRNPAMADMFDPGARELTQFRRQNEMENMRAAAEAADIHRRGLMTPQEIAQQDYADLKSSFDSLIKANEKDPQAQQRLIDWYMAARQEIRQRNTQQLPGGSGGQPASNVSVADNSNAPTGWGPGQGSFGPAHANPSWQMPKIPEKPRDDAADMQAALQGMGFQNAQDAWDKTKASIVSAKRPKWGLHWPQWTDYAPSDDEVNRALLDRLSTVAMPGMNSERRTAVTYNLANIGRRASQGVY